MEQNILKNAALKSTKKRQVLLLLLQKQARPMTAEELHALAEPILPMNASTVYRTLNTLTEKKILIRSVRQDGKAYYSLAKKDHSHRLVCDLCGKVIPVDTCPLSELEETLQQKTGFRITGHSLEFTGLCPECSKRILTKNKKALARSHPTSRKGLFFILPNVPAYGSADIFPRKALFLFFSTIPLNQG